VVLATGPPLSGLELRRSDVQRIRGTGWLNDEVVNYYLYFVGAAYGGQYIFSSFFFAKLCETSAGFDYAGVRRWTKEDIFSREARTTAVPRGLATQRASCGLRRRKTMSAADSFPFLAS
jgi:hypothetical protein